MRQRTILHESSIKGKALHTGQEVELVFKPAPVDHGIVFRRTDLYGKPEIRPLIQGVGDLVRNTTITEGSAQLHTVEHVLSALRGLEITNVIVEINGSEPPIADGSARPFVHALLEAEPVDQDKDQPVFELKEPVCITQGNRSIIALPYDGFKITCTSADDRGIHTQHLSLDINPESYVAQIAPSRTFTIYEDIEPLIKMGKIQGGSLESAVVIKGNTILSKEPLRFSDEFVRHKILDIVGDLQLLGLPLKAHIIAVRTGHALNAQLTQKLSEIYQKSLKSNAAPKPLQTIPATETQLDIRRILEVLPHRYPFLLVDRVLEIKDMQSLVALKNVTINEPFFTGHFPGHPVMPGVLQLEAMAQAAGILLLRHVNAEGKIAFFMSADKVKFRKAVLPGDQLVIEVKIVKLRNNKLAVAEGECRVGDKVVSSAELMFTLVDVE
jgi:UDP-3-O-[3-hydroxymyristoyl] N-acetylglucosamine deacetylase/3-hydroxyacyl-[acyl-carrier-protein] dehydratase